MLCVEQPCCIFPHCKVINIQNWISKYRKWFVFCCRRSQDGVIFTLLRSKWITSSNMSEVKQHCQFKRILVMLAYHTKKMYQKFCWTWTFIPTTIIFVNRKKVLFTFVSSRDNLENKWLSWWKKEVVRKCSIAFTLPWKFYWKRHQEYVRKEMNWHPDDYTISQF